MKTVANDLRGFPAYLGGTMRLWIPFGVIGLSFLLALSLPYEDASPSDLVRLSALMVQLTLPPTALFVFMLGGLLAGRRGYLVGALLGLVDGVLWIIFVSATGASGPSFFASMVDAVAIIAIAVIIGTITAGVVGLLVHIALGRPGHGSRS